MPATSRRAFIGAGMGALAGMAAAGPAAGIAADAPPQRRSTALYESPTNSRLGGSVRVPRPGPVRFPMRFQSPDQLAAYTRYRNLESTPLLLGHRAGYTPDGPWPESALESAQNILATAPSTMVEVDLRMTSDGKCISMHDSTVDRETTGTGQISKLRLNYILRQSLVDNRGQTTQLRAREAWEFFEWGIPAGAVLWLDVKDATPEFTIDLVRQYRAESQVIISAYGAANLTRYRKLAPDLVYFVPKNPKGLDSNSDIHRIGRSRRIIGFAGYYVPDLDAQYWHRRDRPTLIELSPYDQHLPAAQLDPMIYERAVQNGFRVISTNHYRRVAEILGITKWGQPPSI